MGAQGQADPRHEEPAIGGSGSAPSPLVRRQRPHPAELS